MGRYRKRELAKSVVLLTLLVASVLQVGVLWNDTGAAFPFFSNYHVPTSAIPVAESEEAPAEGALALAPYRISVCDGEGSHYIVSRRGDVYAAFADAELEFLEDVLRGRSLRNDMPLEAWGEIATRRGIMFEFAVPIRLDVLKWAVNFYNVATGAPGEIRKIMVTADESAEVARLTGESDRYGAIYVQTADRVMLYSSRSEGQSDIQRLLADGLDSAIGEEAQAADEAGQTQAGAAGAAGGGASGVALGVVSGGATRTTSASLRYTTVFEHAKDWLWLYEPDVLGVMSEPDEGMFRKLRRAAPADVRDRQELEQIILGNDIYSYTRSTDNNNIVSFRNITSVYRLYPGGFMDYRYTPATQPNEKGALVSALQTASAFVQNIEAQLLGSANLYLSGVYDNESDLTYMFTFDYIFDDYPVFFKYTLRQGDDTVTLRHAVTIAATENRAVSCQWMLVDLFFGSDTKQMQASFDTIALPGTGGGGEAGDAGGGGGGGEAGDAGSGENSALQGMQWDAAAVFGMRPYEARALLEQWPIEIGDAPIAGGAPRAPGPPGVPGTSEPVGAAEASDAPPTADLPGIAGIAGMKIVDVSIAFFIDMDAENASESTWPSWALSMYAGEQQAGLSQIEAPMQEGPR